jgi:alpha-tubulin suppressor-like RCC1 family protein
MLTLSACGNGGTSDALTNPPGTDATGPWRQIFGAYAVSCGVTKTGETYCWGANDRGQLGDGTQIQRNAPTKVATTERFVTITGDRYTVCGVTEAGDVYCWGFTAGAVASTPRLVQPGLRARDVAVTDVSACALGTDGVVSCWSATGAPPARPTPVSATLRFRAIAGAEGRFCAVAVSGDAYCWTADDDAAVGAVTRQPAGPPFVSIATGGGAALGTPSTLHACGLTADGTAYCWGVNDLGQLGDGTTTPRPSPVRTAGAAKFASIGARGGRTCALGLDGLGYCWGFADVIGPNGVNTSPKVIDPALRLASVSLGTRHTCAVTPGGAGYCWGAGGSGQLGHGDTPDYVATPQRVLDPS